MRYLSTRGAGPGPDFRAVTLAGLAPDGGLFVPERFPRLDDDAIAALAGLDYAETAARILAPFAEGVLDEAALLALCRDAYGDFGHAAVVPLTQLDARHWLLELFHGPTLAFKDVAMQLLGRLFERFLAGTGERLTLIGATSGDTGSAAIHAVAGLDGVDIVMLHPKGRVSDVQRRQMTTVLAPNVHNLAIEGDFDGCQAIVKQLFRDRDFTSRHRPSAVNSINWARLAAQIVYYFHAAVRLGAPHRPVAFSVPTGNFGDVFAGYCAWRMGLPIARLVVATNVNDILHRALSAGDYSRGVVVETATPSMDIGVSSNFERLLFEEGGRDAAALAAAMAGFEATGRLALPPDQRARIGGLFSSVRVDADTMALALRWANQEAGRLIDPHGAVGLAAARETVLDPAIPIVTLATAHPAKFRDAVERATGVRPGLPPRVGDLFAREERCTTVPATAAAVAAYVDDRLG